MELVRELGPAHGLYGAKITGGGSGGTVAVLGQSTAEPVVRNLAQAYAKETGQRPHLFWGSSPGAAEFGSAEVRWESGAWRVTARTGRPTSARGAE